jgi:hypothetical protein
MPGSDQCTRTPTPTRIDLTQVTEATRRRLYDATVAIHFRVPPDTEDWMPFYNADQAGLTVWHWVLIEESTDGAYGIGFQSV